MLRAMHERVAVIRIDASNNRVRQRSASMADVSVTIAPMIEREIATKSPFFQQLSTNSERCGNAPRRSPRMFHGDTFLNDSSVTRPYLAPFSRSPPRR